MQSKWYEKKPRAVRLRKLGWSIRDVEKELKIPRSTLSEWFRNVHLTSKQKKALLKEWKNGLVRARKNAVKWHNAQKQGRLLEAREESEKVLNRLDLNNKDILDLALAMLYLGEGYKKSEETGMGNSDPALLKTFLYILKKNYNVDTGKIRCELYLRADQDPEELKRFWAKELELPAKNFRYVSIDKRTQGTKTYFHYKGVCGLRCSNVAIQRKLLNLSREFCARLINQRV